MWVWGICSVEIIVGGVLWEGGHLGEALDDQRREDRQCSKRVKAATPARADATSVRESPTADG